MNPIKAVVDAIGRAPQAEISGKLTTARDLLAAGQEQAAGQVLASIEDWSPVRAFFLLFSDLGAYEPSTIVGFFGDMDRDEALRVLDDLIYAADVGAYQLASVPQNQEN